VTVTNLSEFSISVEEAGVFYTGTKECSVYTRPILIDGKPWPRRLVVPRDVV